MTSQMFNIDRLIDITRTTQYFQAMKTTYAFALFDFLTNSMHTQALIQLFLQNTYRR